MCEEPFGLQLPPLFLLAVEVLDEADGAIVDPNEERECVRGCGLKSRSNVCSDSDAEEIPHQAQTFVLYIEETDRLLQYVQDGLQFEDGGVDDGGGLGHGSTRSG